MPPWHGRYRTAASLPSCLYSIDFPDLVPPTRARIMPTYPLNLNLAYRDSRSIDEFLNRLACTLDRYLLFSFCSPLGANNIARTVSSYILLVSLIEIRLAYSFPFDVIDLGNRASMPRKLASSFVFRGGLIRSRLDDTGRC